MLEGRRRKGRRAGGRELGCNRQVGAARRDCGRARAAMAAGRRGACTGVRAQSAASPVLPILVLLSLVAGAAYRPRCSDCGQWPQWPALACPGLPWPALAWSRRLLPTKRGGWPNQGCQGPGQPNAGWRTGARPAAEAIRALPAVMSGAAAPGAAPSACCSMQQRPASRTMACCAATASTVAGAD